MIESTSRWSSYVPPLALMAVIFFLSAQSSLDSGLGDLDLVLRKLAHMTEFGVVALLWWRALRRRNPAILIAIAYAVTDEWHQVSVTGRHGTPVDVLIDAAGVILAVAAYERIRRRRRSGAGGVIRRRPAGIPLASDKDAGLPNSSAIRESEDTV